MAFDEITHFQRIGNHRMALNGMTREKNVWPWVFSNKVWGYAMICHRLHNLHESAFKEQKQLRFSVCLSVNHLLVYLFIVYLFISGKWSQNGETPVSADALLLLCYILYIQTDAYIHRVKRTSAIEHAQNAQIQIILRMRKVSSGHLLYIRTFCIIQ